MYIPGVRYRYQCPCGWAWPLEDGLVPFAADVRCPRCRGSAPAVREDCMDVPAWPLEWDFWAWAQCAILGT